MLLRLGRFGGLSAEASEAPLSLSLNPHFSSGLRLRRVREGCGAMPRAVSVYVYAEDLITRR